MTITVNIRWEPTGPKAVYACSPDAAWILWFHLKGLVPEIQICDAGGPLDFKGGSLYDHTTNQFKLATYNGPSYVFEAQPRQEKP